MKTIYTDKVGLYPWAALFMSAISFWNVFDPISNDGPFGLGNRVGGVFWTLLGGFWLFLALRRIWQVRSAKRDGRDPTIIRVMEDRR